MTFVEGMGHVARLNLRQVSMQELTTWAATDLAGGLGGEVC